MVEATMGNARFFRRSGPYSLAVVTDTARGIADDLELLLEGVAPLQSAGPNEVSFLDNQRYASALDQTLAGAVIVHPAMAARVPTGTVAIQTTEPYAAWARVAALFLSRAVGFSRHSPVRNRGGRGARRPVGRGRAAVGD